MPFTKDEFAKCSIVPGDLLVCEGGDVGRAAIWEKDIPMCIQNHIHRLRAYYPVCTAFYYFAFFVYKSIGLIGGKGIGIQGLSSGALGKLIFPLPPLAEQERIVKQVAIILEKLKDELKDMEVYVHQDLQDENLRDVDIFRINEKIKDLEKQILNVIEG